MTNRIAPMLESINDYYNQPYNEIYRHVIDIAKDARRLDYNASTVKNSRSERVVP